MIDKLNEWIRMRRQYIESERAPGTTYGDTDHDQTAVHFGQLELLEDLQRYVDKQDKQKAVERLKAEIAALEAKIAARKSFLDQVDSDEMNRTN